MKSVTLSVILFILLINVCLSQNTGKVTYTRILSLTENITEKDFELIFNENTSLFTMQINGESKVKDSEVNLNSDDNDTEVSINLALQPELPLAYFTDFYKDSLLSRVSVYSNNKNETIIVKEKIKSISWKITKEQKKIGSFVCNKAVGEFRGRTYKAWFTYDIPVKFGPWKLNGLPGLILQARDSENEVIFNSTFVEIPNPADSQDPFTNFSINNYETFSLKEYIEMKKKEHQEYIKAIQSKLPRGATFVTEDVQINRVEKEFEF